MSEYVYYNLEYRLGTTPPMHYKIISEIFEKMLKWIVDYLKDKNPNLIESDIEYRKDHTISRDYVSTCLKFGYSIWSEEWEAFLKMADTETGRNTAQNIIEQVIANVIGRRDSVIVEKINHSENGKATDGSKEHTDDVDMTGIRSYTPVADVKLYGMETEKYELKTNFITPRIPALKEMKIFGDASSRLLLYGPPGTGKTLFAKYAAYELQKHTGTKVLLFMPALSSLMSQWVGQSERMLTALYTEAKRRAEEAQATAVVFLDEFETLVKSRENRSRGNIATVQTLLQIWDENNLNEIGSGVITIAATNIPGSIDSAILRRFTTQILIDLPSRIAVVQKIEHELRDIFKYTDSKHIDNTDYSSGYRDMASGLVGYCMAKEDAKDRHLSITAHLRDRERIDPNGTSEFGYTLADISSAMTKFRLEYLQGILHDPQSWVKAMDCSKYPCENLTKIAHNDANKAFDDDEWSKLHCMIQEDGKGGYMGYYRHKGDDWQMCVECMKNYVPKRIKMYTSPYMFRISGMYDYIKNELLKILQKIPSSTRVDMYQDILQYNNT